MKVRWTDEAFACFARIEDYYSTRSPRKAQRLIARIVEKAKLLEENPQLGRVVPEHRRPDLRELIEQGYRVFYVIDVEEIRVVAIFYGSALPPEIPLDPVDDGAATTTAQDCAASPAPTTARAAPQDFTSPGESVSSAHPIMAPLSDAPSGTPRAAILDDAARGKHASRLRVPSSTWT